MGRRFLAMPVCAGALAARDVPAFPRSGGFGAATLGGRGGRVLPVTSLNDSGPGSFRAACEAEGPRIVAFRVAGIVNLTQPIQVRHPYLTVAGQTAPGEGVCLRGYPFAIATHDVVVRFLRVRLGDVTRQEEDSLTVGHGTGTWWWTTVPRTGRWTSAFPWRDRWARSRSRGASSGNR